MNITNMFVVFMYITFTSIHVCESAEYSFKEGQNVELRYPFQFGNNKDVELRFQERVPFFKNGKIDENGLSTSQVGRFGVNIEYFEFDYFQAQVIIQNISQEDAGLYWSYIYVDNKRMKEETHVFNISVKFLPGSGKLSCSIVKDKNYGAMHLPGILNNWKLLQCSAPAGNQQTYIACFQNKQILPYLTSAKNETITTAMIWIFSKLTSSSVWCCSTNIEHEVKWDECRDFYVPLLENLNRTWKFWLFLYILGIVVMYVAIKLAKKNISTTKMLKKMD